MSARKADTIFRASGTARRLLLTATLLACAGLLGCVSFPDGPYKLYPGPRRPAEELALVRLEEVARLRIDGLAVDHGDWSEVELLPGDHHIALGQQLRVGSMWGGTWSGRPLGYEERPLEANVTLLAGHRYVTRVRHDEVAHQGCQVEIRDEDSGEMVACWPLEQGGPKMVAYEPQ